MKRIPLDEYFMRIAELVSNRSTCIKRKVGAVLVKDSHVLSTGYNGAPVGLTHCNKNTCIRKDLPDGHKPEFCRGVHAEINCIIQAALHGTLISGNLVIYTTTFPCIDCLKIIINAGIQKVVYKEDYFMDNKIMRQILEESGLVIYNMKFK